VKVIVRPENTLDSIAASMHQFMRNNPYAPSHIFMTKEVWKDIAADSMLEGMCLDAYKPSTHFRLMGLECKIIDGEVYEYYIAFCGT
jgi:hypothetical protein